MLTGYNKNLKKLDHLREIEGENGFYERYSATRGRWERVSRDQYQKITSKPPANLVAAQQAAAALAPPRPQQQSTSLGPIYPSPSRSPLATTYASGAPMNTQPGVEPTEEEEINGASTINNLSLPQVTNMIPRIADRVVQMTGWPIDLGRTNIRSVQQIEDSSSRAQYNYVTRDIDVVLSEFNGRNFDTLRNVLFHELVHVAQHQQFPAFFVTLQSATPSEKASMTKFVEGHAYLLEKEAQERRYQNVDARSTKISKQTREMYIKSEAVLREIMKTRADPAGDIFKNPSMAQKYFF